MTFNFFSAGHLFFSPSAAAPQFSVKIAHPPPGRGCQLRALVPSSYEVFMCPKVSQSQFFLLSVLFKGLPRWHSGKESTCQHRRPGIDPWVGKIPWRKKWRPPPEFLPGEFHGQRSLVHYSPRGHEESDTTEHTCT